VYSWAGERKSEIGKQRKKEKGGLVKESQKRKTEKKEEGPLVKKVRNRSQRKKERKKEEEEAKIPAGIVFFGRNTEIQPVHPV
jgi:hypothetical protein